jgi:hypothetical protein
MMSDPSADPRVAGRITSVLRPGETLLWCGKPDTKVVFRGSDILAIPFGAVFLGGSLYWIEAARSSAQVGAGSSDFWLFGIPFVLIGCYLLVGRFFTSWWRKRRSVYAVTSERVIAVVGSSLSTAPANTGSMQVRRSMTRRHATVIFEPFGSYYQWQPGTMTGPAMTPGGPPTVGPSTRRRVAPGAVAFYDVAAPDQLLAAVNQAKVPR